MPPFGLEFISPILTNLSDEITKINNLLPKIVDIKSEVINTADTVRSMKIQISNLEQKNINHSSPGITSASYLNVQPNLNKPSPIAADHHVSSPLNKIGSPSPGMIKTPNNNLVSNAKSNKIVELQRNIYKDIQPRNVTQGDISARVNVPGTEVDNEDCDDKSWTLYERKKRNYRNKDGNSENRKSSLITGSKKFTGNSLKGITKTVDVFIGRLDASTTPVEIKSYIESDFNIKVLNTEKLSINNTTYNCFKVNVHIQDREKLFNSDMWP